MYEPRKAALLHTGQGGSPSAGITFLATFLEPSEPLFQWRTQLPKPCLWTCQRPRAKRSIRRKRTFLIRFGGFGYTPEHDAQQAPTLGAFRSLQSPPAKGSNKALHRSLQEPLEASRSARGESYILNPKSQILNPKSYILNPKP